jgi:FMN reductase
MSEPTPIKPTPIKPTASKPTASKPTASKPTAIKQPRTIAVVTAGLSQPSSTRLLADQLAAATVSQLPAGAEVVTIELRDLAHDVVNNLLTGFPAPALRQAIEQVTGADAVIAVTPLYSGSYNGLFKSFFDVLDNDLLIAKPVVLAATAGTARHALVADDQLRPLFAYLRALPVPTSLFAAPEDWADPALNQRVDRAVRELILLMESGFARAVRDESWSSYQHEFGTTGTAGEAAIELDTDLMRLATGGSARRSGAR